MRGFLAVYLVKLIGVFHFLESMEIEHIILLGPCNEKSLEKTGLLLAHFFRYFYWFQFFHRKYVLGPPVQEDRTFFIGDDALVLA